MWNSFLMLSIPPALMMPPSEGKDTSKCASSYNGYPTKGMF